MSRRRATRASPAVVMLPVVLLLGACAGRAADAGPVERLRFTECADRLPVAEANIGQSRLDRLEFSCARLPVPLNHADPDGAQLSVAVVRVRSHDQQRRLGSLVLNPGGPGQSGSAYVAYWASWLSDDVLSRFDVVTFDPRGTGASEPIDCGPVPADTELSRFPDLLSETGYAAAAAVSRQPMDACAQVLGRRAPFFSTQQTARDLELLRQALGDRRLTYVGFSYGAKLGAEYAHQFPERVRALVLDAPSDPSKDPVAVTEAQVAAFERSFQSWADDCPARPTCAPLGDPRTYVADLVARAGDAPIASRRPGGDLPATGADVMEAVQALLYQQATWPLLDDALAEATAGDSGSIHEAIDHANGRSGADDGVPDPADAGLVINCNDRPPGPTEAEIKAAARRLTARLPVFGAWGSWGLFGCAFWPVERHVLEPPTAPTAALVLVVGSVGDPATPYAGAVRLVEALGHATLLTWEGNGHTAYGQSDCINHLVDDYLIRRAAPDPGTHCPG